MDEEVKIPIGLEVDEDSIDSAIKKINNRLRSLKGADTKAANEQAKIDKQLLDLKGKTSKADKEQVKTLQQQWNILKEKRTQNTFDRIDAQKQLELLKDQKRALQDKQSIESGNTGRVVERTDKEMRTLEDLQKMGEAAKKIVDDANSITDRLRANVKRTADEMKLEIQKIASTMTQQPSKSFDTDTNKQIKLLQQNIARAQIAAQDEAKKLDEPWKLKIDVKDMQAELESVNREVESQTAEVERLKQAYDRAKASASEIANAFKPGTYSTEELTLEMEKIKGAEQEANRLGEAYNAANIKLKDMTAQADELSNRIVETKNRAKEMIDALKSDVHNEPKVSANEEVFKQYEAAVDRVDELKAELSEVYDTAEKGNLVKEQDLEIAKQIEETLRGIGNEVRNIQETGSLFGETEASKAAKISPKVANKEEIQALNAEKSAIKQSAAQYYYKLRAVKMLGFVVNSANATMDKFGKTTLSVATKSLNAFLKLIPGVNSLKKAISGATSEQKKLARETSKTTKANTGFNLSLKDIIKNVLKYGLGIRSLFVLFNKLRKAITDGIGSMSKQIADVNTQMSSIVTSMNQMKAGITAAIQPLLSVLAPALERIAAAVAEICYQIASFIAALTGQSVVYKAARVQTDYAASLDKTGKSAKKAKKELAGFDELNVLHTKDNGGDSTGGMGWDPVELSQKAVDFANKIKEIFQRLFAPIKAAWDKIKNYVIKAWQYAANEIKKLGQDMARDFWKVWEEQDTQKIFEQMFLIIGDIGLIIGNLTKNFRIAWNEANNGYRILKSIRDIILIIISGIRDCTKYTADWADKLSFIPLLSALADNMQTKLVPAVQQVVDLFRVLYEQILLKIIKDFIEKGLPQMIDIIGNLVRAVGNIADNIRIAIQSGSNGIAIVTRFENLFQIIADAIEDCSEKTSAWAAELDFRPLLESTIKFLENAKPLIEAISSALSSLWNNTLLPFYTYLVEKGFPKLLDALGEITGGDWSKFTENVESLTEALEPFFELAWETLVQILQDVGLALKDFLNSDDLGSMIDKFKEWVDNADPEELAKKIEHLAEAFIALKAGLNVFAKVILPVITGFMTIQNVFNQMDMVKKIAKISEDVAKLSGSGGAGSAGLSGLSKIFGNITTEAKTFGAVMQNLGDVMNTPITSVEGLTEAMGSFAGPGGALVAATGVLTSFKGGIDMMNEGFSLGSEALTVFGGILTTVGLLIAGVAAWPAVIIGAITVLIANLGAFGDELYDFFVTGFGDILNQVHEFFENLGYNVGKKVGELLANLITWLGELPGKIQEWLDGVDWKEFGINILKGILAIFMSIPDMLVLIIDAIASFLDGFIKGLKDGFDMHSPSKKMEPYGKMILEGILQGIINVISTIGSWIMNNIVTPIINGIKSGFTSAINTAKTVGSNVINGIRTGITNGIASVIAKIQSCVQSVKNTFSSGLSASTLINVGYNLLVGLINGIVNGINLAIQKVAQGCQSIVNVAKNVFNIGSPSKVFEQIGEWDMEGLTNGIEEGTKTAENTMEDAMENLVPDVTTSDSFANSFLDTLTDMKTSAVEIVNSMIDELSESMANLSGPFNIDIATQMNKLSSVSVPSIAQGKTLPSTAEFTQSATIAEGDYSKLAGAISSAIIDAISTTRYNNTDSGDTVINIDGREVFRAVKSQNEIYRKSTGKSAF